MSHSRREFIRRAAATAGGLAVTASIPLPGAATPQTIRQRKNRPTSVGTASTPMNLLILGGTSFLGPHQVAHALERGHRVSIFTRGRTIPTIHPEAFDHVEHLIGDRADDLTALEGRTWDAVIDNSGHRVAWARNSAKLLKERVSTYLFTSSTGVYYPYLGEDIDEETTLVRAVPDGIDKIQAMEYGYGVMKANSESEVVAAFGKDRSLLIRPTYMVGPGDRTDRFTYWPVRLEKGGEVMIPGRPDDPVQYIDVRDVAEWMIRLLEEGDSGTYNAVGPASRQGMHEFVHGAHAASSSRVEWVSIPDYEFLRAHGVLDVIPWIMPVGDNFGSARVNFERARSKGLAYRPLAHTCSDIINWWQSDAVTREHRQRLEDGADSLIVRESSIIEAWKQKS